MKKVVIYPGRFQPMLPHHAEVYKKLQADFSDADIFVATSDKVDGKKSPFNFKEKAEIMAQLHDIPVDKIILAPQPYLIDSYKKNFNQEETMVIFAVGQKDAEERFPMKNVDEKTGLDMRVRGEPGPKYYQMINTLKQHPALPMSERGYIHVAPNVGKNGEVASASAFRQAFTSVGSEQEQREVFERHFGTFNQTIFALFKNKLLGDKMKEDLDILKKLAGLSEAPINFGDVDTGMTDDDDDEYATNPGYSQDNMINQLGKVIDSEDAGKDAEDMKIKNFKPVTSVTTDDGKTVDISPAEAKALKGMFEMLPSQRGGEEKSPREKFQDAIQKEEGLMQMLDFAKSKNMIKKEEIEMPELDLSDIRQEYSIEEEDLEEGKLKNVIIDAMEMSPEEFEKAYGDSYDQDSLRKQYDDSHPEYEEPREPTEESAPFGEPSQQDMMYDQLNDAYQKGEEELAKELGMTPEQLDDELNDISLETGLHMDDDRDEIVQRYIEDTVDNADYKDHGEYEGEAMEDLDRLRQLAGMEEASPSAAATKAARGTGQSAAQISKGIDMIGKRGDRASQGASEMARNMEMLLNSPFGPRVMSMIDKLKAEQGKGEFPQPVSGGAVSKGDGKIKQGDTIQ